MSFRVVRQSKFRHVFGTCAKKDECFDGVRITRNAWDSSFCDVNGKFIAVVIESQGGGSYLVVRLDQTGRIDLNQPVVNGHAAAVLDIQFCPHNDNLIASCGEDCMVKVFQIPDAGLTDTMGADDALVSCEGHQRRVGIVKWHPCTENVLLSAGFDYTIFIWDVAEGAALNEINCHNDTIFSVAWNFDGSLIATTSKDKKIRVIDPRAGTVVSEGKGHEGAKASHVTFVTGGNVMTTGFTRTSERQCAIWDPKNLGKPLKLEMIDTASGVLFIHFDPDTQMVYIGGKGDGNIRYYEIEASAPYSHYLSEFKSSLPARGFGWMPKRHLDLNKCEVARCLKLHPKGLCEFISFTVPRKSTLFQDDIYPDTFAGEPSMGVAEWMGGANTPPRLMSLKDGFQAQSRAGAKSGGVKMSSAAKVVKKPAASSADSEIPKDVVGLTKAYKAHVKQIAELQAKIAELEAK